MTCSYDSTIRLWDQRNIKNPIEELSLPGKSLWDIKFGGDNKMGIASIYEGYLFTLSRTPDSMLEWLVTGSYDQYQGHTSICYAFEYVEDDLLLTSSFYDNTL